MLRVVAVRKVPAGASQGEREPLARVVLSSDERHIRRRVIQLASGLKVLVDLAEPTVLQADDRLVIEDGNEVVIAAADESLYEVTGRDPVHLSELAWHIGNRHLSAAIEASRILILRDHVIRAMLEGLGGQVAEIVAPFNPVRGAYSGGGSSAHGHHHPEHNHHHDHGQGHHSHD